MSLIRAWLAMIVALAATPVSAMEVTGFQNGNDLYALCAVGGQGPANGGCKGYVLGAFDMLSYMDFSREKPLTCLPRDLAVDEVVDVTRKYLRENPAKRHLNGGEIIANAMLEAYPCK